MEKGGFIYILTNKNNTVLYIGVTSNIANRLFQHRTGQFKNAFTSRYNLSKLVYFEKFNSIEFAILKEKQLKAGSRQKKINLIESINPDWNDLSGSFF
ncbi:MAG: GIY-YIG nuclease family protein [Bacteroidales bacterium]|nr:GIY-YIG nuclease family protein [Bacteroidales bacterium]MCF8390635.1 GIY-YIG nuclease family protein [Bacteroidales bacterium]